MSFSTKTQQQNSEIIQDTDPDTNLDNEGDQLSATANNLTLAKLARMIYGLWALIGATGKRHSATFFSGNDITLTGTITSSGVTVTGSSSLFLSELEVGDFISGTANEWREVLSISLNTSLVLVSSFTSNIGVAQVYKRRRKLAERLDSFTIARGLIIGGLIFNAVSLPPTITDGSYEVNGKTVQFTSNQTLGLSDTFLQSKQGFDSYCHYLICLDNNGNKKYILSGEGAVATASGNITSITGGTTTKTLTVSSGTAVSGSSKILVITGNDGVNGVFKITGGNGSTTYTFESQASITGTNIGSWIVYERISTLHGTGSNVAVTTDAEVIKYTPSYAENSFASGYVAWNGTLGGYYLTISGLTGYRVIGNFRTNGSSQVTTDLVSHKTARNKNDNSAQFGTVTGWGSTGTRVVRWTNMYKLRGSDYIYQTDSTNGMKITLKKKSLVSSSFCMTETVSTTIAITVNASSLSTNVGSMAEEEVPAIAYSVANQIIEVSKSIKMNENDILRTQSNQQGSPGGGERFNFEMDLI